MSTLSLPFSLPAADSTRRSGFRLQRFELYNWGTFHDRVWCIEPQGENLLVTGDIGSGKSTVVDALTTLFVAPQKIAYNKAAGAETRERSLRSYVAGYYKSERGDPGLSAKPVALRDRNTYSVILGRFYAAEFDQYVTLAQVFWMREATGQPERLYVIADQPLSISQDFSSFGGEIRELRRRLRGMNVELHESFASYGAAYRRRFGIPDEQAMDLFHQTVSMKSVGNLTEFVREHMLQAFDVEGRIHALMSHYDDLNRAHDAVLIAKDQIQRLTPLMSDVDTLNGIVTENALLVKCREALRPWFASQKADLLRQRLQTLSTSIQRHAVQIAKYTTDRREISATCEELRRAIAENGGERIEQLTHHIERLTAELTERRRRCRLYDTLVEHLNLPAANDLESFTANREALGGERHALEEIRARTQAELTEEAIVERELRRTSGEIQGELESLRLRRSNVPKSMLDLRARLCSALGCEEDALPFAGELLAVRATALAWEGAAERVLHSFGLSLIVPETLYPAVAQWVDTTHIGGRLVYYRVRAQRHADGHYGTLDPDSLITKLAIVPDTPFQVWLESELIRRFNYICCDSMERFRREPRAITQSGHMKFSDERHEKDDRRHIGDRSQYILGWSNEAKIAALEGQAAELKNRVVASQQRSLQSEAQRKVAQARLGIVDQLTSYENFADVDWRPIAVSITELEAERRTLTEGSDVLRTLEQRLQESNARAEQIEAQLTKHQREHSVAEQKLSDGQEALQNCEAVLELTSREDQQSYFPKLQAMRGEALGDQNITVESCDNREREMREWLQVKIDATVRRCERLREAIVRAMQAYLGRYPEQEHELDASLAAADGYRQVLTRLSSDDLPQFEARFKELLNENAIREIANFQSHLNRELQTTIDRIESINRSLRDIDYNSGRYIILEAEASPDGEVRDFRRDLRSCTEGTLTGSSDQQYAEAKFLQVKRIIERFRGREGTGEIDRRWTRKVTDVRNWQTFSASERWREDNREHEHYTDSGGKSGGQKEKLAYTVLAASIAYQFGLERRASRSFRLVAIDEAFGRGSDESARYGLELFKRLDLQLMVITPLQKIRIIEPFVSTVTFVHNDGRHSQLHNLTIEEYQAERAARME